MVDCYLDQNARNAGLRNVMSAPSVEVDFRLKDRQFHLIDLNVLVTNDDIQLALKENSCL